MTKPISLENLDPYWTSIIAKTNIENYLSTAPEVAPNIKFYVSKLISDEILIVTKKYIGAVHKLFWRIAPKYSEALFYHSEDMEWAKSNVDILMGRDVPDDYVPARCANAWEARNANNVSVFTAAFCENGGAGRWLPEAPHEYVHVVQDSIGKFFDFQPCWSTEGMANYYGVAIAKPNQDFLKGLIKQDLNSTINSLDPNQTLGSLLLSNSIDTTVRIMSKMEVSNPEDRLAACYQLGGWAYEALVATFGQDKIVEYISTFRDQNGWKVNFETVFGIKPEVFYAKLTPYFAVKAKELLS